MTSVKLAQYYPCPWIFHYNFFSLSPTVHTTFPTSITVPVQKKKKKPYNSVAASVCTALKDCSWIVQCPAHVLHKTGLVVGKLQAKSEIWCVTKFSLACNSSIIVTFYSFNKFLLSYTLYCDINMLEIIHGSASTHIYYCHLIYVHTGYKKIIHSLHLQQFMVHEEYRMSADHKPAKIKVSCSCTMLGSMSTVTQLYIRDAGTHRHKMYQPVSLST
jgi:hypothetical protein